MNVKGRGLTNGRGTGRTGEKVQRQKGKADESRMECAHFKSDQNCRTGLCGWGYQAGKLAQDEANARAA